MNNRLKVAMLGAVLALAALATGRAVAEVPAEGGRQAAGLLVKLKDRTSASASVVRQAALQTQADGGAEHGRRLASILSRQAIPHRGQRATAFAARVVRFDQPRPLAEAQALAAQLRQNADVEWVAVDEVLKPQAVARVSATQVTGALDPAYASQTWLQARSTNDDRAGLMDVPVAWRRLQGRLLTPVTVAVLDSGTLPADDLSGRLWPGYDFVSRVEASRDGNGQDPDPTDEGSWVTDADNNTWGAGKCKVGHSEWHGLSVTYMLAAASNNGLMGVGLLAPLPGQVVLPVRVAGACGASLSDLVEGMLWSAGLDYQGRPTPNLTPARVINVSFGGEGDCGDTTPGSMGWLLQKTIDALATQGALVVAAAGNGDASGVGQLVPHMPANCAGVMAVTALDLRGYKAGYANFVNGEQQFGVSVAAGNTTWSVSGPVLVSDDDGITSLSNRGTTVALPGSAGLTMRHDLVGTSFAAPQVAGVAALMLAVDPGLSRDQLLAALRANVRAFPVISPRVGGAAFPTCSAEQNAYCNCTPTTCGSGILDAGLAVDWAVRHADANGVSDPAVTPADTSYFVPDRDRAVGRLSSSGGGGGGAVGEGELWLGLAGLLALAVFNARRQERQAMKPLS
ncbi:MAG: hypothetical protein RI907_396 [Pseudomonadota bacterium]|jgi:serine protease